MSNKLSSIAGTLGPIYVSQSEAHFNQNEKTYRSFADSFSSKDEFLKIFDRSELKSSLMELIGREHTAGEWIAKKSQMEYIAGLERDYRTRMRTRLDFSRSGALGSNFVKMSMTNCASRINMML